MTEKNIGALMVVDKELAKLEQTWANQMLKVVGTKGLAAKDLIDIVQEMTAVQGRILGIRCVMADHIKRKQEEFLFVPPVPPEKYEFVPPKSLKKAKQAREV
jgi:hypothetical protein